LVISKIPSCMCSVCSVFPPRCLWLRLAE